MIVNNIPDDQIEQLIKVPSSTDGMMEYRPCQVVLKSGEVIDNVYIQEVTEYLTVWGIMPDEDAGKRYALIENVTEIRESPNRLTPEFANTLYEAGESGMGYCLFKLVFADGYSLDVGTGNAVDFIPLPNGRRNVEIIDVLPHEGSRKTFVQGPAYYWCLFKE